MDKYIISSAKEMPETSAEDTAKYGRTWYCMVEEIAYPVMFNLTGGQQVQEGDRITFEEQTVQNFKSGKNAGKEYRRLKKVKVEEGAPRMVTEDTVKASLIPTDLEARVKALEDKVFGNGTDPFADMPEDFLN